MNKGKGSCVDKGSQSVRLCGSVYSTHTCNVQSTDSLHLEHLHHLLALGVIATVSTATAEKLDDDGDDETAGRPDDKFTAED